MDASQIPDFKRLMNFLGQAVTLTSNAKDALLFGCENIRELLTSWVKTHNTVSDEVTACIGLGQEEQRCKPKRKENVKENDMKERNKQEINKSQQRFTNISKNIGGKMNVQTTSKEKGIIGKRDVLRKHKECVTMPIRSNVVQKEQKREKQTKDNLSSAYTSGFKLKQSKSEFRTTYQDAFSVTRKVQQNMNNIKQRKDFSKVDVSTRSTSSKDCTVNKHENLVGEGKNVCDVGTLPNKNEVHKLTQNCGTLEEAMDMLNKNEISSELIRCFKLQYKFLLDIQENNVHQAETLNAASEAAFLKLFFELTKANWRNNLSEPLGNLIADSMIIAGGVFCTNESTPINNSREEVELKKIYERLEKNFLRLSNQDNIVHSANRTKTMYFNNRHAVAPIKDMAIWYQRHMPVFEGLKGKQFVFYKDEKKLQKLQKNLQLIQQLQLQVHITEVLLSEIIPQLEKMQPHDKYFQIMIKVVWALTDIMRLPMPIFITP